MSVPKGKRNKSKVEFDDLFFRVAENTANIVENHFGVKDDVYEKHKIYIDTTGSELLKTVNDILIHIRMANVYPTCLTEYETRRDCMSRAIGMCFSILTTYQLVMHRFNIDDNKYVTDIKDIWHFINSIKSWRSSDNRFKKQFELLKEDKSKNNQIKEKGSSNKNQAFQKSNQVQNQNQSLIEVHYKSKIPEHKEGPYKLQDHIEIPEHILSQIQNQYQPQL